MRKLDESLVPILRKWIANGDSTISTYLAHLDTWEVHNTKEQAYMYVDNVTYLKIHNERL